MKFDILKEFMDSLTDSFVPGNSICVYKDNEEIFRYSSGYSDVENKKKMTGDELLYIYSCSKVTTVTAALQLLERGKYLLNEPLSEYMPEFSEMYVREKDSSLKKAVHSIKIKDLFTMTAGFNYNMGEACDYIKNSRAVTDGKMNTTEVIKRLSQEPLDFEPGTKWEYSLCHDVLAAFVERVSGKRFSEYVRENIFDPLEMTNSFYHISETEKERMAEQYRFKTTQECDDLVKAQQSGNERTGIWENVGKVNSFVPGEEYDSGGAGIITTVPDYAKLTNALANWGRGKNGERILAKGTVELLRTNQLSPELLRYFNWNQLKGYGYGLGVRTLMDKTKASSIGALGEFGWGGAAGATALIDPDNCFSFFYAHHMLNPQEGYYQPRIRNAAYACIDI